MQLIETLHANVRIETPDTYGSYFLSNPNIKTKINIYVSNLK